MKKWNEVKESLPGDHGRFWVYVEEVGELGVSHFEWNCSYDPATKTFSDNCQSMNVTHWTELMGAPTQENMESIDKKLIVIDCEEEDVVTITVGSKSIVNMNGSVLIDAIFLWHNTIKELEEDNADG